MQCCDHRDVSVRLPTDRTPLSPSFPRCSARLQLFTPIPPQYKDRLSAKQLLVASSLVSLGLIVSGLRDYTECVVDDDAGLLRRSRHPGRVLSAEMKAMRRQLGQLSVSISMDVHARSST